MATSGRTHLIFEGNTVTTGVVINPQRQGAQTGTLHCEFAEFATKGFKLEVQGRISADMPWAILTSFDQSDMDRLGSATASIRIFPEMRGEVVSVTGAPTANGIHCRLLEG